ncbi:hypothetical protein Smp_196850 [Schistosoma mansoni]|nr:hypothetical protein Smp_196850 [Schistosoma mansoni]|eukprot:XP_018648714.1 hypothetical protein Smp_196850 [Schistosoma mansoni]
MNTLAIQSCSCLRETKLTLARKWVGGLINHKAGH